MTNKEKTFVIGCIDFCQAHGKMVDEDMIIANDIVNELHSEMAGNRAVSHKLSKPKTIPAKVLNDYACRTADVDWNRELKELRGE